VSSLSSPLVSLLVSPLGSFFSTGVSPGLSVTVLVKAAGAVVDPLTWSLPWSYFAVSLSLVSLSVSPSVSHPSPSPQSLTYASVPKSLPLPHFSLNTFSHAGSPGSSIRLDFSSRFATWSPMDPFLYDVEVQTHTHERLVRDQVRDKAKDKVRDQVRG